MRLSQPLESRELGFGRSQFAGGHGVSKTARFVAAVAEGLIGGLAAATETDGGATSQSKRLSFGIYNLEVTFDAKGTIVIYRDFGCRQFFLLGSSFHHTASPSAYLIPPTRKR
jgi:hypothetical protein